MTDEIIMEYLLCRCLTNMSTGLNCVEATRKG